MIKQEGVSMLEDGRGYDKLNKKQRMNQRNRPWTPEAAKGIETKKSDRDKEASVQQCVYVMSADAATSHTLSVTGKLI